MSVAVEPKLYTPDEYLALEETAVEKHEYHHGELREMSGGTLSHTRISTNIVSQLGALLRGTKCEPLNSDIKLWIDAHDLFTYPDAMIVCGKVEFGKGRKDLIINPSVLFEVLSQSTADYDRGDKFKMYRTIETLQEYVLIDQRKVHIELYRRIEDKKWLLTETADLGAAVRLESAGIELSVATLYERVDFSAEV